MKARPIRSAILASALWATALALTIPAGASAVTITLGTPDPSQGTEPLAECALVPGCTTKTVVPTGLADPSAALVAPADGTIVSWRVKGAPPGFLRLRTVRAEADGSFKGIGTSGAAKVSDGLTDNFLKMAIEAGQQLGVELASQPSSANSTDLFGVPALGGAGVLWDPGLPDHATAAPTETFSGTEPLFNATVELLRPTIFQLSPLTGPVSGGTPVYITGRHLTEVTGVSFGGIPAQVVEQIPEQVLVIAPPHAAGRVDVTLSTAGGPSFDSVADDFTYLAPTQPPPPDTAKPRLLALKLSPKAFLAALTGPSALASAALGAELSYRLSEPATVSFKVARKRGKRFIPISGGFEVEGKAGKNRLRFTGRLNRRALAPGRYRLTARATDLAGNRSKPKRQSFQILDR